MSVDCVGELTGCVTDRNVVDIIELVVKHESKLRKLIKALKRCCVYSSSSSDAEDLKDNGESKKI
jgi:hypothetical protein